MNSLRRMLGVLTLFNAERSTITIATVCKELGYAQASAYRYVRELSLAGLLVRLPRGYALGPRVIELDRQMTEFDPVLARGRALADDLVAQTGLDLLVSELHGNTVTTVFVKAASDSSPLRYGRGKPIELFLSSTSRVVLANLSPKQLRRLYEANEGREDLKTLGSTWREFSKTMLKIRKDGYCISHGELDPAKTGIAAPIFDERRRVMGSITLIGVTSRFDAFNESFVARLICEAAADITRAIADGNAN